MDTIFSSCKRGDMERVKYFVEKKEIDVNARDNWDSTPLYYACLCGHFGLVQYLLANGARCEEGSRDGERCVYGALTNDIREYLLKSQVITPESKTRDEYQSFCERLWKSTESDDEDATDFKFVLDDSSTYKVHRSVLCARSEYFRQKFQDDWQDRKSIVVRMMSSGVFVAFLQYIYTGKTIVPKDKIDDLCHFAEICQLDKLKNEVVAATQKVENFVHSKYGVRLSISKVTVESQKLIWDVQQDFGLLISLGLPSEYCDWLPSYELPFMSTPSPHFDLCFCVDDKEFYCHKLFVSMRSSYFDGLLRDHFQEACSDDETHVTRITLREISPDVLASVLYFIYTNNDQLITKETVQELLWKAEMFLLPGLKRLCGNYLASTISLENIISILKVSRFYEIPKLEDICTGFMAKHIETLVDNPDFHEIVISDAAEVQNREDTDSIPVIDDIRYHITMCVQTFSQVEVANEKLRVIDELLEKLGLDG